MRSPTASPRRANDREQHGAGQRSGRRRRPAPHAGAGDARASLSPRNAQCGQSCGWRGSRGWPGAGLPSGFPGTGPHPRRARRVAPGSQDAGASPRGGRAPRCASDSPTRSRGGGPGRPGAQPRVAGAVAVLTGPRRGSAARGHGEAPSGPPCTAAPGSPRRLPPAWTAGLQGKRQAEAAQRAAGRAAGRARRRRLRHPQTRRLDSAGRPTGVLAAGGAKTGSAPFPGTPRSHVHPSRTGRWSPGRGGALAGGEAGHPARARARLSHVTRVCGRRGRVAQVAGRLLPRLPLARLLRGMAGLSQGQGWTGHPGPGEVTEAGE